MRVFNFTNIFLFFWPLSSIAQSLGSPQPPGGMSLYEYIQILLNIVTKLAIPVLGVLIVYWGFRLVSAAGNEQELAEAKHGFVKGLSIAAAFLALAVLATIIYNVGKSIGFPVLFPAD